MIVEAEIDRDDEIIFRVFDYGYRNALNNRTINKADGEYILNFPEPKIIYIYSNSPVPDEYELTLDFGKQGSFKYKVETVNLHTMSIQEINDRKMIILIPFKLLELREALRKDRSQMNIDALQSLIFDGIIGSIRANIKCGNITVADGRMLINMTKYLYDYLYARYSELREVTKLTDESILLEIEVVEKKYEEKLAEKDEKLAEKDEKLAEKDNEIRRLREELAAYKS
jgi:hypothetical protein